MRAAPHCYREKWDRRDQEARRLGETGRLPGGDEMLLQACSPISAGLRCKVFTLPNHPPTHTERLVAP